MKLVIGADHRGFEIKEKIKELLNELKISYEDIGALKYDPYDDYVDIAEKAIPYVKKGSNAILICGSGVGMGITANKHKGVYAAVVHDVDGAKLSREHNDSNVLCLGVNHFEITRDIVKTWLKTKFSNEERHKRRIEKIKELEDKNFK
jgi:ribose 5-phosphate isomerase B